MTTGGVSKVGSEEQPSERREYTREESSLWKAKKQGELSRLQETKRGL